ncbi:zinc finger protein 471-like [Anopheles nili]|uniref:zinc finger protein 471-like n=1 Tax=Anopheles nili TaxID=185578 RepID=UPI00237AA090|nr:zinc finger protein 471-like [Anopheles nili]
MTVFNLLTFPNVCRACLQSIHPDQMIGLDTYRPVLEGTIEAFLEHISFKPPKEISPLLPSSICFACLEVVEFFSKYCRKIMHLHEFLIALVRVKLGDELPLRKLFASKAEQLEVLFMGLDLCNKTNPHVDDLLEEYSQYTIASMATIIDQDQLEVDEPIASHAFEQSSEEDMDKYSPPMVAQKETSSIGVKVKKRRKKRLLKIEIDRKSRIDTEATVTIGTEAVLKEDCEVSATESDKCNRQANCNQIRERFYCGQCPFKSYYTVAFELHVKKHQKNLGKTGFVCSNPYCVQMFDTAEELSNHKKSNAHSQYVCEICGTELKHRNSLEVHLERHAGITHHQCPYCSSSFHTKTELKNHVLSMHISEDRADCDQCGAVFTSKKLLKQHLKSHTAVRNFHCVQCTLSFKTFHHLRRHIKAVHNDVRFQCEHCNASYCRRDKLRMHIEKAHLIQTYFVCEICMRSFDTNEGLQEHRGHHENPKELECGTCLLVCLTQESFDKHMCITYQDDYVCCGRDFKHHMLYNKHMMSHGIKVNARVRVKSNMLIGQERAIRDSAEFRTEDYRFKNRARRQGKRPRLDCVQCMKSFNSIAERQQHVCNGIDDNTNVEINVKETYVNADDDQTDLVGLEPTDFIVLQE